jgi:hypothetical protein
VSSVPFDPTTVSHGLNSEDRADDAAANQASSLARAQCLQALPTGTLCHGPTPRPLALGPFYQGLTLRP